MSSHQGLQRLDAQHVLARVDHRMTVRADRTQVANGIDLVLFPKFGKRPQVMDMDEASASRAIHSLEVEAAGHAGAAVVLDALAPRCRIAFVTVLGDLPRLAFNVGRRKSEVGSLWKAVLTAGQSDGPSCSPTSQLIQRRSRADLGPLRERSTAAQTPPCAAQVKTPRRREQVRVRILGVGEETGRMIAAPRLKTLVGVSLEFVRKHRDHPCNAEPGLADQTARPLA